MFRMRSSLALCAIIATSTLPLAQDAAPQKPNYKQAALYSAEFLRERTYSTSVQPQWIGETDRFWYSYRDRFGTRYCMVDPAAGVKSPLFDHERIAAELSVHVRKPHDATHLTLVNAKVDDDGKLLSFVFEKTKFELDLLSGELVNKGEASEEEQRSRSTRRFGRRGGFRGTPQPDQGGTRTHRNFSPDHTAYVFEQGHNLYYVEASDEVKAEIKVIDERLEKEKAEEEAAEKEKQGETGDAKKTVEDEGEKQETDKTEKTEKTDKVEKTEKTDKVEKTEKTEEQTEVGENQEQLQEGDVETTEDEGEKGEEVVEEQQDQDTEVVKQKVTVVEVKPVDKDAPPPKPEEADERDRWALEVDESKALQLTTDGEEDYSFSGRGGFGRRSTDMEDQGDLFENAQGEDFQYDDYAYDLESRDDWPRPQDEDDSKDEDEDEEDPKTRPSVNWAPDSTAFYAIRRDSRGVQELFLVNSIAEPRPALEKYKYPMPGEEKIRRSELFLFDRAATKLTRLAPKWKDEGYTDMSWTEEGHLLRMLRRDRLLRNIELCTLDPTTMTCKVLIEEGFEEATISPKRVRYLDDRKEMIWWSERTGWGHFYLYGQDGKLKNAITSGPFLASSVVEVDEEKGLLYFRGNGREAGENTYYEHLYRVFLDGSGLACLDPDDATHRSSLSPTQSYLVDNSSRVDMAPRTVVRNSLGREVMIRDSSGDEGTLLEGSDLTRLYEAGWAMPETFTVKAADGVTDLFGNMWKPFDFDPTKSYPIIAEVYPGPQTEGVSHTFSASNGRQQLAQIGFIVIQVGHRGGTPRRSKEYHSYGYFNLRDYGLADKKSAIEQLARRHSFIDVDRVGLYGHSGGGFMTAAALMLPPYNEFFKVGVASSGNHDNNIYNGSWSERYHGLKQVEVKKEDGDESDRGRRTGSREGRVSASAPLQDGRQRGERGERGRGRGEKDGGDKQQKDEEQETRFEIHIPTNQELAENLRGNLLLVHGEIDNNVHPANTMRLVDALIKANKRFDMLIIPGARHGYGAANGYFNQRKWEFFAEHLLGDHQTGAEISIKE